MSCLLGKVDGEAVVIDSHDTNPYQITRDLAVAEMIAHRRRLASDHESDLLVRMVRDQEIAPNATAIPRQLSLFTVVARGDV
jgi:hypothetical protein